MSYLICRGQEEQGEGDGGHGQEGPPEAQEVAPEAIAEKDEAAEEAEGGRQQNRPPGGGRRGQPALGAGGDPRLVRVEEEAREDGPEDGGQEGLEDGGGRVGAQEEGGQRGKGGRVVDGLSGGDLVVLGHEGVQDVVERGGSRQDGGGVAGARAQGRLHRGEVTSC